MLLDAGSQLMANLLQPDPMKTRVGTAINCPTLFQEDLPQGGTVAVT
jgi:hypothetical protein